MAWTVWLTSPRQSLAVARVHVADSAPGGTTASSFSFLRTSSATLPGQSGPADLVGKADGVGGEVVPQERPLAAGAVEQQGVEHRVEPALGVGRTPW